MKKKKKKHCKRRVNCSSFPLAGSRLTNHFDFLVQFATAGYYGHGYEQSNGFKTAT